MEMENLKQWILDTAEGEAIEAVVIGEMGWGNYGHDAVKNYSQMPKGKLLTWDEAEKWIDYEFDSGYGAPGCQAIYAWTANKVIAISAYGGATSCYSIPRNPIDVMPFMEGGYRPAVLSRLFQIFRASGVSADEFVRHEYVLSPFIR